MVRTQWLKILSILFIGKKYQSLQRTPAGPILDVVIISIENEEALIKDQGWNILRGTEQHGWRMFLGDFTDRALYWKE